MYEDLIKRLRELQAITEHCDEHSCFECENRELCDKHDNKTVSGTYKEAADAIEEMSRLHEAQRQNLITLMNEEPEPKWIPVTERLPDGRDSVLALTGDCDIYVCDYIPSVKQFWTIPGDELHIDDITHWMPLPEPLKAEEGE